MEKNESYFPGMECECGAWSSNECACGADWTDSAVYDLRYYIRKVQALIELTPSSDNDNINQAIELCKKATKDL